MVQRKAPPKLAVLPHHLKAEALFHQSSKGSPDLKKKMMKKSGSIKRPKTPNYMKPTTSSDARKEKSQSQSPVSTRNSSISRRKSCDSLKNGVSSGKKATKTLLGRSLTKNTSFKPLRGTPRRCSTVGLCENLDAQRATCSSTLKDCKFPAYLKLNHGGTELEGESAVKVCPYTYCSLNGHHHAPLPPLKSFLSARRRTIKTQKSVKLACLSPRRTSPVADVEEGDKDKDFFIEIYTKKDGEDQEQAQAPINDDSEARDETPLFVELLNELPADVRSDDSGIGEDQEQAPIYEARDETLRSDQLDDSDIDWETGYQSSLHLDYDYEYTPAINMEPDPEEGGDGGKNVIIDDEFIVYSDGKDCAFDEVSQESYEESMNSDAFSSNNDDDDDDDDDPSHESVPNITSGPVDSERVQCDDLGPETEEIALALLKTRAKKCVEESDDELGCFNPRGPNFLDLEEECDGEKVDLRHQDLDERRNSEEWMVDYALRQVVNKLGPARKKKVALLVEAFEKVRKHDLGSAFDQARTLQACI